MSEKKSTLTLITLPKIDFEVLKRQLGHSVSLHIAQYVARPSKSDKPLDDGPGSFITATLRL